MLFPLVLWWKTVKYVQEVDIRAKVKRALAAHRPFSFYICLAKDSGNHFKASFK